MSNSRRATQIDFVVAGVRDSSGTLLSGGTLIAHDPFVLSSTGFPVRKDIYQDADKTSPHPLQQVALDSNGAATVFAEGNYRLRFFANGAAVPSTEAEDADDVNFPPTREYDQFYYGFEVVNAADFGAKADGKINNSTSGTDNQKALQAAIDYCLRDNGRPKRLFIGAGVYRIGGPLFIMRRATGRAVAYEQVSIHVFGERRSSPFQEDTVIYADFANAPAIVIQGSRGVRIKDIGVKGVNIWDTLWPKIKIQNNIITQITDDSWLLRDTFSYTTKKGGCRDNVNSPYAGIAIDPFALATTTGGVVDMGNRYPGLEALYVLSKDASSQQSTAIVLEGCAFERFIVGVIVSPTGIDGNAEDITIRECTFNYNKIALAVCQSQARNLNLENTSSFGGQFWIDTRTYGNGRGEIPHVRGANVGGMKYLFNVDTGGQSAWFEQIYSERCLSLGYVGTGFNATENGAHFVGCSFNFSLVRPAIDMHLFNFAQVRFVGCSFSVYLYDNFDGSISKTRQHPPLTFANFAPLSFEGCNLATLDLQGDIATDPELFDSAGITFAGSIPIGFSDPTLVTFKRLKVADGALGAVPYSYLSSSYPDANTMVRNMVPPGAVINEPASIAPGLRVVTSDLTEIPISTSGTVLLKPSSVGEATFKPSLAGVLRVGDVVYNRTGWLPEEYDDAPTYVKKGNTYLLPKQKSAYTTFGVCGMITSISGIPPVARLSFVPQNIYLNLPAVLELRVRRFPRYHGASTGIVPSAASGTKIISAVTYIGNWSLGDRIQAEIGGVPLLEDGTYVVAINTNPLFPQLTISRAVKAGGAGGTARLFDANVAIFRGTME